MKYLLGIGLILFALVIFGGTFIPIIRQEIDFRLNKYDSPQEIKQVTPVDTDFGIMIPRIQANAKVIKDVDPFISTEYQVALTRGVAHAKGSSLPGQPGNIFLFSHSAVDFLNATKYNSIFYLLTKLEKDDSIKLIYEEKEYDYSVIAKSIVNSDDIEYLTLEPTKEETLTLMTCWPPGTSLKRLIVQATRQLTQSENILY
jgi:sortase A